MNREEATRKFLEITLGREDAAKVIAHCNGIEAGILRLKGIGKKSCHLLMDQLKLVQELAAGGEVPSEKIVELEARLKAVENRLGTF